MAEKTVGEDEVDYTELMGMPPEEYYKQKGVKHASEFVKNSRGMSLFTQSWIPEEGNPKALLFLFHGYANDSSWLLQLLAVEFARNRYAVFAMDLECHGRSDGVRCANRNLDHVVDDCTAHYSSIQALPAFSHLRSFAYGESMGGALVIVSSVEGRLKLDGVVLASPMCKIKDSLRPPFAIQKAFEAIAYLIPDAAIVPTQPTIDFSCRDPIRLHLAKINPRRYVGKPRLACALELLRVTEKVQQSMPLVATPFLVIHGEADLVTDPAASKELCQVAASKDKALKLYPNGWHSLLSGEPEKERGEVFQDVLAWLDERAQAPDA